MKKIVTLLLTVLSGFFELNAIENQYAGARPQALAGAYVAVNDVWGTFYNQAGLSTVKTISAGVFYESRFQLKELSLVAATVVLPVRSTTFGFSYSQFGKGTFKETKVGLAISKKLSKKLYAGVQFDYLMALLPENQRSKGFVTIEGGVIYKYSNNLQVGVHIFNPIKQGLKTLNMDVTTPLIVKTGGCYFFSEELLMCFEIEKPSPGSTIYKAAVEYKPVKNLTLRLGSFGKPFSYTTGIGYQFRNITADIGFDYHGNLGVTPSISIQFEL